MTFVGPGQQGQRSRDQASQESWHSQDEQLHHGRLTSRLL
jgi:hypothetical protein